MAANYDDARKRSVDNLQRLYTVVVSLALTESLRRTLLSTANTVELNWSNKWLMFLSLIFTVIPFYHGANRYLDATYVTKERRPTVRYALMIDFLFLFFQALLLFTLALLVTSDASLTQTNDTLFFCGLAGLLVVDIVWVTVTRFVSEDDTGSGAVQTSAYRNWMVINIFTVAVILFLVWREMWNWMMLVTFTRSVLDYLMAHEFYYPTSGVGGGQG